jgi:hypothetical protein
VALQGSESTSGLSGSALADGSPSRAPDRPSWGCAGFQRFGCKRYRPYWLTDPGSRFGGGPVFPPTPRAGIRRCRPRLSWPRAPLQGTTGESTPASRPDGTLLGFAPLRRMKESRVRSPRACHARHLPSSAFLTPSTASSPQPRPGLFHPGNARGVVVFRAFSAPVVGTSLEAPALLPLRSTGPFREDGAQVARLQSFVPTGAAGFATGRKTPAIVPS